MLNSHIGKDFSSLVSAINFFEHFWCCKSIGKRSLWLQHLWTQHNHFLWELSFCIEVDSNMRWKIAWRIESFKLDYYQLSLFLADLHFFTLTQRCILSSPRKTHTALLTLSKLETKLKSTQYFWRKSHHFARCTL